MTTGPTFISSDNLTINGGNFNQHNAGHLDNPPPNPRLEPTQHPQGNKPEPAPTGSINVTTETSSSTSVVHPIVQPTSSVIHPNRDAPPQSSLDSQPSTSTLVHQPIQSHLSDDADTELFSVYSTKSRELYKLIQTEIRFGIYDQMPYSILGFRLQRGGHTKQCLEVQLTGTFTHNDKYKNVDVKYLWHKPSKENTLVDVEIQKIFNDQLQGQVGISGNNPVGLMTYVHSESTLYKLTVGQEITAHFNKSSAKGNFVITLSFDNVINHGSDLSVAKLVTFFVVLKLQKDRQPMELKLEMDVKYKSASTFHGGIHSARPARLTEVYTGNPDHDMIKNQSEMPSFKP